MGVPGSALAVIETTNAPMAAAFRRAGYTESERIRLDLV